MVGLTYATIWQMMKQNAFPRSIVIGRGSAPKVAWRLSEVLAWMDSRPRQTFVGDPGREETAADIARQEAGRRGGQERARRARMMARPRLRMMMKE
jgi:predicted DNA-binding transcriptional regulator AlpA